MMHRYRIIGISYVRPILEPTPGNFFPPRKVNKFLGILSLLSTSLLLDLHTSVASAQVDVADALTPNYIVGPGLSPSYFVPQSPTNPSVASAPAPAPAVVGSGVSPNYLAPPSVESLPAIPMVPPPGVTLGQAPPESINLDLRSPTTTATSGSFSTPSNRPLSSPSPWFFSANALILDAKDNHNRLFSSLADDPSVGLLTSNNIHMHRTGGYELGIGRYFGCGKYAVNANYWGLSPADSIATANALSNGPLATNIPFNTLSSSTPARIEGLFVGPTPMSDLFHNASEHRLQSQRDLNNLELNLYWFAIGSAARQPLAPSCNDSRLWSLSEQPTSANAPWFQTPSRLRLSMYSGVRWFQFQDGLHYSAQDAYYKTDVKNDLWGIQTGAIGHWSMNPRWSLWSNLNGGVYNNHGQFQTSAGNNSGLATIAAPGSPNGTIYNFASTNNSTAFLGETTTGLGWHFGRGWTANIGYRILGASGLAAAQSQIPNDFRVPSQAASIQSNDSLILHGLTLGATYNF